MSEGFITATRTATSNPAVAISMTPSLRVKSTCSAGLSAINSATTGTTTEWPMTFGAVIFNTPERPEPPDETESNAESRASMSVIA